MFVTTNNDLQPVQVGLFYHRLPNGVGVEMCCLITKVEDKYVVFNKDNDGPVFYPSSNFTRGPLCSILPRFSLSFQSLDQS